MLKFRSILCMKGSNERNIPTSCYVLRQDSRSKRAMGVHYIKRYVKDVDGKFFFQNSATQALLFECTSDRDSRPIWWTRSKGDGRYSIHRKFLGVIIIGRVNGNDARGSCFSIEPQRVLTCHHGHAVGDRSIGIVKNTSY